ncbi:hypothetical protein CEXT_24661 [Caerostris extrusa]|uniref:Uncharacterized protein n=1 Tax=Caerostris extrusa TaxID=172846 RepID=A0AAV4VAD0_CAEEX|nr:hypothetical protein CEXT_24661 [Caerostris extrusa]
MSSRYLPQPMESTGHSQLRLVIFQVDRSLVGFYRSEMKRNERIISVSVPRPEMSLLHRTEIPCPSNGFSCLFVHRKLTFRFGRLVTGFCIQIEKVLLIAHPSCVIRCSSLLRSFPFK